MANEILTSNAPPRTKIFVGRLPEGAHSDDLRQLFERYGIVTECDVLYRYGFVHMETEEMAARAIDALNNSEFLGVRISVEQSTGKKGGRGFSDGSYSSMRTRGSIRGARSSPYVRPSARIYDRRPALLPFERDDYDYYGRSRGPPGYSRAGDRIFASDLTDKYERGIFGRGGQDSLWMRRGTFDYNSDVNGPQFSSSMYRRRSPPPPSSRFVDDHFGTGNMDTYGPFHREFRA